MTIGFIVLTVCVILLIVVPLLILLIRNSSQSFLKQTCPSSSPLADVTQKLFEDGETNYSVQTWRIRNEWISLKCDPARTNLEEFWHAAIFLPGGGEWGSGEDTPFYYSTNCNTIQIWSWCSWYLSSVGNRYPAIYVASSVGRKSEVKKCRQKDLKMLRAVLVSICWIIKQLSCSISRNIVWF